MTAEQASRVGVWLLIVAVCLSLLDATLDLRFRVYLGYLIPTAFVVGSIGVVLLLAPVLAGFSSVPLDPESDSNESDLEETKLP